MAELLPKHWCHIVCGEQIFKAYAAKAEMVMIYQVPPVLDQWWTGYECPHGYPYWLRPTDAQIERWEAEGTR